MPWSKAWGQCSLELKDGEDPILFLSRKLLPPEQKYTLIEKECLAAKWVLEAFCYYLLEA